ncbi:MAG: dinitrogenase iron-molybdenum cofactor biosynthesis protein [Deltaproteobacteria bacterium]|nr:dinitrogenase iron-molybdenum cofactor biosynthesis protein [Deltaproteobacteria bacterium]
MKIALPSRDGQVDSHFGHCDHFTVFTVDKEKNIVSQERFDPPEGCGCKSNVASVLAEMGVTVMLAGNMGQGAVNVLGNNGIKVYRGCAGDLEAVVESWLSGQVVDSGVGCTSHGSCSH